MDIRNAPHAGPTPATRKPGPAGWRRFGLPAILGLVAGAVLFPRPAGGRERPRPGPKPAKRPDKELAKEPAKSADGPPSRR